MPGFRAAELNDVQGDYNRVLKYRLGQERRTRTVPSLLGKGGVAAPRAFTAGADYIRRLQAGNDLRNVAGQNVQFETGFICKDIAADAMVGAPEAVANQLALLIAAMGQSANRKVGLARIHQEIARHAHSAVVLEYNGKFGFGNQYRKGMNRETGKMGPAIKSFDWISATRDGILYMDKAFLGREAKHWYRLNFGAQPRGGKKDAKSYSPSFGGQKSGSKLSLRSNRPSGRFMVPVGIWLSSGGEAVRPDVNRRGLDQFFTPKWLKKNAKGIPLGSAQAKNFISSMTKLRSEERISTKKDPGKTPFAKAVESKGIRGAHFFDAGVKVIAKEIGPAYENLLEIWTEEASTSGTGPVAKVIATAS